MILSDDDPAPVVFFGPADSETWLLTCEHAGNAIPASLGGLGLDPADLQDHIGWDPGALELAIALADRLAARGVAQAYSRLLIDCNRPLGAPDLVPDTSDMRAVPGNTGISQEQYTARWTEIHQPFHRAVAVESDRHKALISVHSFTRRKRDGATRATEIGLLARDENPLFRHLMSALPHLWPGPVVANDPYEIEDESDYTIPVHAEPRGLPHLLLEIRNDLIADQSGVDRVADALVAALKGFPT